MSGLGFSRYLDVAEHAEAREPVKEKFEGYTFLSQYRIPANLISVCVKVNLARAGVEME